MVVGNLNTSENCDVAVIGGGPGGYVCAIRLAQMGKDVILIDERATLGGVCLNEGCIPSKALIHAADIYTQFAQAHKMGISFDGSLRLDVSTLQQWKDGIVKRLTTGVAQLQKSWGVRILQGRARFIDAHQIEVMDVKRGALTVDFAQAVVATGSLPTSLPHLPIDGQFIIGSKDALTLPNIPEHLVVVGGGYIGLELGTAYCKLGAQVTVVEISDHLLGNTVEPEIHELLLSKAQKLGMKILLKHRAIEAIPSKLGSLLVQDPEGGSLQLPANHILISVGRRPNTSDLGLDKIGLHTDQLGFIAVDAQRRTQIKHIYAIGDVTGQPMLAHKAYLEAKIAAESMLGHAVAYDVRGVPAVMFTDPEIATVGLTAAQAAQAGYQVSVGLFPWRASGRALSLDAADGLTKVVIDADSQRILGVHIAGAHAAELIAEGTLALELDAFIDDLTQTIHPHPTLSETILEAAEMTSNSCAHYHSSTRATVK
jgi:dihydrolipoamide dehydrogenase